MRKQKEEHTLIVIGYVSDKSCYLDISRDEAIRRYKAGFTEPFTDEEWADFEIHNIEEIKFEDEFCAYDVWSTD